MKNEKKKERYILVYDIFGLNVYCRHSGYLKFIYNLKMLKSKEKVERKEEKESVVFGAYIKIKVINKKNIYLLNNLSEDAKTLFSQSTVEPVFKGAL